MKALLYIAAIALSGVVIVGATANLIMSAPPPREVRLPQRPPARIGFSESPESALKRQVAELTAEVASLRRRDQDQWQRHAALWSWVNSLDAEIERINARLAPPVGPPADHTIDQRLR